MTGPLCRKCGSLLHQHDRDHNNEYHPTCAPQGYLFSEPERPGETNGHPYAGQIRDDLTRIIKWADRNSPRSKQTEIGASELGGDCFRRLGYRIAEVPHANTGTDPWPAIVGTAVHIWMEQAIRHWEARDGVQERFRTEMLVRPSSVVKGHTDLYDIPFNAVVDYKTAGTEKMRELRKLGEEAVPVDYIQQVQLYGLGHVRAGRRVDTVCLVFLPRAGWLSGMWVWSAPYDEAVALAALDRLNRVAAGLIHYNVTDDPSNWVKIPAAPDAKACSWCPWFNSGVEVASDAGCPGK